MGDEEGAARADPRVEYISARVQATFPKMVVSVRCAVCGCCYAAFVCADVFI